MPPLKTLTKYKRGCLVAPRRRISDLISMKKRMQVPLAGVPGKSVISHPHPDERYKGLDRVKATRSWWLLAWEVTLTASTHVYMIMTSKNHHYSARNFYVTKLMYAWVGKKKKKKKRVWCVHKTLATMWLFFSAGCAGLLWLHHRVKTVLRYFDFCMSTNKT